MEKLQWITWIEMELLLQSDSCVDVKKFAGCSLIPSEVSDDVGILSGLRVVRRAALPSLRCSWWAANMSPPGCGSRHYLNTRCRCGLLHGCSAGWPGKCIIDSVWSMQSKARNPFDLSQKMCRSRSEAATCARHWEARAANFPVITAAFNLFS